MLPPVRVVPLPRPIPARLAIPHRRQLPPQPGVLQHLRRGGALPREIVKHGVKEVAQAARLQGNEATASAREWVGALAASLSAPGAGRRRRRRGARGSKLAARRIVVII